MIIIIDFEGVKCMKYSKQREALLTLLRSTRSHPSADWLYENLRKEFPNISLGTVYRNLAQLAENGDILKIITSANKEHFDGFVHRHFHFVCNKCDKIYDVDLDGMDKIKNQAAEKLNADIEDYSLIFYGICENCSSKKIGCINLRFLQPIFLIMMVMVRVIFRYTCAAAFCLTMLIRGFKFKR